MQNLLWLIVGRANLSTGEILGFTAGAVVTLSYIPQIVRVFRLKSSREISLPFTALLLTGICLWLAYGIAIRSVPIILWNAVGGIQAALLFYAKLKYGKGLHQTQK